jgi:predicted porin
MKQKEYNIGASYDPGNWLIQAEYTYAKLAGLSPNHTAYYVLGGYRLGTFTPYAMYANIKPDDTPGFPIRHQNTTSLGLRWDAMRNIAVKLQYDHVQLGKDNTGFFTRVKPALAGSNVNVLGLAVDFVF